MKTKGNRTIIYKIASVVMVLMMTLALTPILSDVVYAAEDKTQAGLGLGVSDLNNPDPNPPTLKYESEGRASHP